MKNLFSRFGCRSVRRHRHRVRPHRRPHLRRHHRRRHRCRHWPQEPLQRRVEQPDLIVLDCGHATAPQCGAVVVYSRKARLRPARSTIPAESGLLGKHSVNQLRIVWLNVVLTRPARAADNGADRDFRSIPRADDLRGLVRSFHDDDLEPDLACARRHLCRWLCHRRSARPGDRHPSGLRVRRPGAHLRHVRIRLDRGRRRQARGGNRRLARLATSRRFQDCRPRCSAGC